MATTQLDFEISKMTFSSDAESIKLFGQHLVDAEGKAKDILWKIIYNFLNDNDKEIIGYAVSRINEELSEAKRLLNDN